MKEHLTTFDEHLERRYGPIGTAERANFEIKAKAFTEEQLALLADIEKSEQDEKANRIFTTTEVKDRLNEWLSSLD